MRMASKCQNRHTCAVLHIWCYSAQPNQSPAMTKKASKISDSIPPARRYERGDRLPVQAQRIWQILTAFVMYGTEPGVTMRKKCMTYGDLALKMGYPDPRAGHTLGRQLGIIGYYCRLNDLPPLNAIVVNQDTNLPGSEVVLREGASLRNEQLAVIKEDWFSIRPPTTGTLRQVLEATDSPLFAPRRRK